MNQGFFPWNNLLELFAQQNWFHIPNNILSVKGKHIPVSLATLPTVSSHKQMQNLQEMVT